MQSSSQTAVIAVDADRCINCHACIGACPVKHCNDGSGDHVEVDPDGCIGCGACVAACHHEARSVVDDTRRFLDDLAAGTPIVAIVAPAVAAVFPDRWLRFNGWLKGRGVRAVFDVSYGAELTVKSYLDHMARNKPALVIAQPCPAIVSYIETYRPELIPHLAPVDSPMLHTARMVRRYHPELAGCRIAVCSPCAAKRREFDATGIGDYNVTFAALRAAIDATPGGLDACPEADYDNPPAERAALFSTPGGLLRTAQRWNPGIDAAARRIEGPEQVYRYLDELPASLARREAPLLIDCLNCDLGCNGGPGTGNHDQPRDRIEAAVARRAAGLRARHEAELGRRRDEQSVRRRIEASLDRHWEPGLYARTYRDRSGAVRHDAPDGAEQARIYTAMEKRGPEDELDCGGCGYGTCAGMATAIHHGRNRASNCHLYRRRRIEDLAMRAADMRSVGGNAQRMGAGMEEMSASVTDISANAQNALESARDGTHLAEEAGAAMERLRDAGKRIGELTGTIVRITSQTRLLALNATIEAARAGDAGRGFAVVAAEVKALAATTQEAADRIAAGTAAIGTESDGVAALLGRLRTASQRIEEDQASIAAAVEQQAGAARTLSATVQAISGDVERRVGEMAAYAEASGIAMPGSPEGVTASRPPEPPAPAPPAR